MKQSDPLCHSMQRNLAGEEEFKKIFTKPPSLKKIPDLSTGQYVIPKEWKLHEYAFMSHLF